MFHLFSPKVGGASNKRRVVKREPAADVLAFYSPKFEVFRASVFSPYPRARSFICKLVGSVRKHRRKFSRIKEKELCPTLSSKANR